nr:hypothetical protein [Micromonospora sp. DSM 115978]
MMESAMYQFLLDVPQATAIWLGLLVVALLAMVGLVARAGPPADEAPSDLSGPSGPSDLPGPSDPSGLSGPSEPVGSIEPNGLSEPVGSFVPVGPARPAQRGRRRRLVSIVRSVVSDRGRQRPADRRQARLIAEVRELSRYAEEVAVAAGRAEVTARRRREQWAVAQDRVEAAWQALVAAEVEVDRLAAASVLPTPRTPRTPAEYADRERYLHRAAMAACVRKELSVLDLSAALANREGWDPRRHPVEQELVLRRAARDELRAAERVAAGRERTAWDEAGVALVAARALRQEAAEAAERVRLARGRLGSLALGSLTGCRPEPDSVPRPARSAQRRWRVARAG